MPDDSSTARASDGGRPAALDVAGLRVSFPGGVRALRGVDLRIEPGELVALVGESGSGKSMLGLAALGLLPDDAEVSGSARLLDVDMVSADAETRRRARKAHVGAVFQDPMTSLNPTMRIERQVAEAAGEGGAAVKELLEAVGIPAPDRRMRQYPHELSGGLRQRVMIAMAIAGRPALVVADEPTTALDVTVQAGIARLFTELRDRLGLATLFITHDLALAASIADRTVVLYGGRVAESGPTAQLCRAPSHPYTAALLAARLPLTSDGASLRPIPGDPPDPRRAADGCPFAPRCSFRADACELPEPPLRRSADGLLRNACARAGEIPAVPHPPLAEARERPIGRAPAASGTPALRLTDVTKRFGDVTVLDDVSLTVEAGEAVAVVGESGCGKTTTLRIAVGLEKATSGTVELAPGSRPQLVFQDVGASLTAWLPVKQLLRERLQVERVPRAEHAARIAAALELVGLPREVGEVRPGRLSGGQRQRVALARSIIVPPAFLICDEPTSALDVSLAANVLLLLRKLRAQLGMGLVVVTHDVGVARAVADRVVVMDGGRIVESGPTAQVLDAPVAEQTRALLAAVPTIA
ncbi:ABC transporter ATP-binding protein [Conexibacter stalactiti]|uniref:ABC transporter ATP-binding protein n=1 Tax=Conexibacter stalactiti TaxID=1940611 RepID=A0ABU4HNI6_9ACTN|nr:ABC transporter ATP-binding protein [Conexibacter stalactiti]MDW5594834.1 ABC transporter ATP-binding protein [Conexibacter stalactiti]MEC5035476.1 ABC transporter ATP-binding protein [Conexibacter stalactiti]